jgi:hypothetical protein
MAHLPRLVALFLALGVGVGVVFAAGPVAGGGTQNVREYKVVESGGVWSSGKEAASVAYFAAVYGTTTCSSSGSTTYTYVSSNANSVPDTGGQFTITYRATIWTNPGAPTYTPACIQQAQQTMARALTYRDTQEPVACPTNATLVGSTCICNAAFVPGGNPHGSACEASGTVCPQYAAGVTSAYQYQTQGKPEGTTFCDSSTYCSFKAAFGAQNYTGTGWTMTGPYSAPGSDCTPVATQSPTPSPVTSAASAPASGCKVGEVQGTVNGQTVCVWSPTTATQDDISAGAPAGAASAPAVTAGDGSGGTTGVPPGGTATRITECVGIQCTTTTTIRDAGGNIVGVNSVQTVGHPDAGGGSGGDGDGGGLCEESPEIPICQTSSFSGSCAASFTCDGDAIQCAIAQDQHLRHCTMFDSTHADATNGLAMIDRTGSKLGGALGTPDNPIEVDVGGMMAAGPGSTYSTACPADIVYSTSFGNITIPLAAACPALQLAGQIAVAFTLLSCALMLVSKGPA